MRENEPVGAEQSAPAVERSDVFESWQAAGLDYRQAFRTTQAIRGLAGHNITETIRLQQEKADSRLDAFQANLREEFRSALGLLTTQVGTLTNQVGTLTNQVGTLRAEVGALRREVSLHRWVFLIILALLAILVALGLIQLPHVRSGQQSTVEQAVEAPAVPESSEPVPPRQPIPPQPVQQ